MRNTRGGAGRAAAAAAVVLASGVIAGCLGSSSTGGQDPLEPELSMRIIGPSEPIPVLPEGVDISCGGTPSSTAIEVEIRRDGGSGNVADLNGTPVQGAVSFTGDGFATLSRVDDADDPPEDPADSECRQQYAAIPVELTAGRALFFLTGHLAGNVRFSASASVDGADLAANRTFTIGTPGSGTPQHFLLHGPIPRNIPLDRSRPFTLTVVDEGGHRVPDPVDGTTNVELSIEQGGGFVDAYLVEKETGSNIGTLALATTNGQVNFEIRSGPNPGTAGLRVTATDTTGEAGPGFQPPEYVYGISVTEPHTGGPPLTILTNPTLATAQIGSPYVALLTAQGGHGPLTWTLEEDGLPSGLQLQSRGVIAGTPDDPLDNNRRFHMLLRVTDEQGFYEEEVFTLTVGDPNS